MSAAAPFVLTHDLLAIDLETGCLVYQGPVDRNGYPRNLEYRAVYEREVGPIPLGWQVDHVYERGCAYHACLNPDHLEAVTREVNFSRAYAAGRAGHRTRDQRHMMLPLVRRPSPPPSPPPAPPTVSPAPDPVRRPVRRQAARFWDEESGLARQIATWEQHRERVAHAG